MLDPLKEDNVMRIAECTDSFLPIVDGVGRVVYQYACSLSLSGNECYVITPIQDIAGSNRLRLWISKA